MVRVYFRVLEWNVCLQTKAYEVKKRKKTSRPGAAPGRLIKKKKVPVILLISKERILSALDRVILLLLQKLFQLPDPPSQLLILSPGGF